MRLLLIDERVNASKSAAALRGLPLFRQAKVSLARKTMPEISRESVGAEAFLIKYGLHRHYKTRFQVNFLLGLLVSPEEI